MNPLASTYKNIVERSGRASSIPDDLYNSLTCRWHEPRPETLVFHGFTSCGNCQTMIHRHPHGGWTCGRIIPDHWGEFRKWAEENNPVLVQGGGAFVSCGCVRTAEALEAARKRDANLPWIAEHRRTLRNFDAIPNTQEMTNAVARFCRRDGPPMLVLCSQVGSGKTHLLEAIGNAMLEQNRSVRYERAEGLIDAIRNAKDVESDVAVTSLLAWYDGFDTLLIDDIGMVPPTKKGAGYLTAVIESRYGTGRRLALATNLTPGPISKAFGDRMADRMFNREQGVATVVSDAESYRQTGPA